MDTSANAALTGIAVKVHGHLKILEYADQAAYDSKTPTGVLLNRRNAVHKDNASVLLVRALTHRQSIAYMVFGNGGTILDETGSITFRPPNVLGPQQELYRQTFFSLIDDQRGAPPGNQMSMRHIADSLFSDVEIRCLIGTNQPFGQRMSNAISGSFHTSFTFDEIGLKLDDGTLLTHVIFTPVLKTATSLLEVVYTIRVAISSSSVPSPTPPEPVLLNLNGVEATAETAELKPPIPPACLAGFEWQSIIGNTGAEAPLQQEATNQLDKFGQYYLSTGGSVNIYNTATGTIIGSFDTAYIADGIDAWYGSPIFNRQNLGLLGSAVATPILGGEYLVCYVAGANNSVSFARWFTILEPVDGAAPNVIGAVWLANLTGPVPGVWLGVANQQTVNDPILYRAGSGFGGFAEVIAVIPSVSDIISGTYRAGWPGLGPARVPQVIYSPINNNLSTGGLFAATAPTNGSLQSGFMLPNSVGGTNLYFYLNRSYMDWSAGIHGGALVNTEVHGVIAPAYPNGAMLKIDLGVLDYFTLATYASAHSGLANGTGTNPYTIDNGNWLDASNIPQIPFQDEYTYISTKAPGGNDCYTMQPGAVINRGSGIYWIVFYMPGIDDAINNGTNFSDTIRVFQYNAATEQAIQLVEHTCAVYTSSQINFHLNRFNDWTQLFDVIDNGNGTFTLDILGYRYDSTKTTYRSNFMKFSL